MASVMMTTISPNRRNVVGGGTTMMTISIYQMTITAMMTAMIMLKVTTTVAQNK